MLVSANNLKSLITTRLASSPGGLDLCQLANANTEVSTGYRVPSASCLPSSLCNVGKFAYINDECTYVLSTGNGWSTNFTSQKSPRDDLEGVLWGLNATCGPNYSLLATVDSRPTFCECVYNPRRFKFIDNNILCADDYQIGCNNFFYIKNGTAYGWGCQPYGELGTGDSSYKSSPVQITNINNWRKIYPARSVSLGVTLSGEVWSWGHNNYGQLGLNTGNVTCYSPQRVCLLPGTNWCEVYGNGSCAVWAINSSGTMYAWGYNLYGMLGIGDCSTRCSPVQVGGGNWCKIASSTQYTNLALRTDGTLWGWGYNGSGEIGNNTATVQVSPVQVSGGGTNWCSIGISVGGSAGIKTDGTLWTWGQQPFTLIASGIARSSPGTAEYCSTGWSKLVHLNESGTSAILGIKTDGTLWGWGNYCCTILGFNAEGNYYCFFGPARVGSSSDSFVDVKITYDTAVGIAAVSGGL